MAILLSILYSEREGSLGWVACAVCLTWQLRLPVSSPPSLVMSYNTLRLLGNPNSSDEATVNVIYGHRICLTTDKLLLEDRPLTSRSLTCHYMTHSYTLLLRCLAYLRQPYVVCSAAARGCLIKSKCSYQFVSEYGTDSLPKYLNYNVENKTNGPSFPPCVDC